MSTPLRVLVLEDNPSDAELVVYELRQAGFELDWKRVDSEPDYLALLDSNLDVILADYHLPQFNGLDALHLMQDRGLDIPFILITGSLGDELAAESVRRGAADFLLKDRLARLGQAVTRALEQKRLREEKERGVADLRKSEERYRKLFQESKDAIYVTTIEGAFVDVNQSTLDLFGYTDLPPIVVPQVMRHW